jgi:hypothetical protein
MLQISPPLTVCCIFKPTQGAGFCTIVVWRYFGGLCSFGDLFINSSAGEQ